MSVICRATAKEKSRHRADIFSRAHFIPAALIFRAAAFLSMGRPAII